jgi:hypothetical protein
LAGEPKIFLKAKSFNGRIPMTIATSFRLKITRAQESRTEEIRIFNPQDFPAGIGVTRVIIPLIGRIAKRIGL